MEGLIFEFSNRLEIEWDERIDEIVRGSSMLGPDAPKDLKDVEFRSHQSLVLRRLLLAAKAASLPDELGPDSFIAGNKIDEACDLARDILSAFYGVFNVKLATDTNAVYHDMSMFADIPGYNLTQYTEKFGSIRSNNNDLGASVRSYLDSSHRDDEIDRMLVRSIIDVEATIFIEKSPAFNKFHQEMERSISAQLSRTAAGRIAFFLIAILTVNVGLWYLSGQDSISIYFPLAVTTVSMILVYLLFFGLISNKVLQAKKQNEKLSAQLRIAAEFSNIHDDLSGNGPISLRFLRQRLNETSTNGVVWPTAIWALLDDIEARGHIRI